jgi:hypothetical protein
VRTLPPEALKPYPWSCSADEICSNRKAAILHASPPWSTGERDARVRIVGSFLVVDEMSNGESGICSARTGHLGSAIPAPPLDAIS